jgi:rRNA small subunit pseudouridine methyltransferase Nep1
MGRKGTKDESSSASSSSDDDIDESEQKTKKQRMGESRTSVAANNPALTPLPVVAAASDFTIGANIVVAKKNEQFPIIILLDQATLETIKNKRNVYELLNCDDHRELCRKKLKKDPNVFRPDILHQELLALMDSPTNKAGLLKIYIQTQKKVLIELHPSVRIPRTYKRFSGLMVQLLHKMKIKAGTESTILLKVIKNPFSQYLPAGTRCYGMSCQGTLYSPVALASTLLPEAPPSLSILDSNGNQQHVASSSSSSSSSTTTPSNHHPPTCFIVGAMSTGHVTLEDHPYMEKMISVSNYPLSGAAALSRILGGIEHHWGIV